VIIGIEGCIGSGKSTTARIVSHRLDWGLLLGNALSDAFLAEFYSDPGRVALETELGFLLIHYHQLRTLQRENFLIADFVPERDLFFARLNLKDAELKVFEDLYKFLVNQVDRPVLTIYLRVPLEELDRRIRERGRPYEMYMTAEYLKSVYEMYERNYIELGPDVRVVEVAPGSTEVEVADAVHAVIRNSGLCA
jgi:deoxyguanosine kinase